MMMTFIKVNRGHISGQGTCHCDDTVMYSLFCFVLFFCKAVGFNNSLTLIENNFKFYT